MKKNSSNVKIDAVIPWVNGNDVKWQKKINNHKKVKIDFNKKKESVRFNSIGEIDITIKSIIKYAPFIKNIFLVTDDQTLDSFDNLKSLARKKGINLALIDHKIIFKDFEDCLPCFNSCSIGSMLFRIPNIAEHFVIFNDDTFLMRETKPTDFFVNNHPVIRGKWLSFSENQVFKNFFKKYLIKIGLQKKKKGFSFKRVQQTSAKLAGTNRYIRRFHTPVSVRKSTLVNFYQNNNLLYNNIKHRFRDESQFITSSLSEHLEIKANTYIYKKNIQLTYFRSYKKHFMVKLKLFLFTQNSKNLFMTFQSLEMANEKSQKYILNWINKRIE